MPIAVNPSTSRSGALYMSGNRGCRLLIITFVATTDKIAICSLPLSKRTWNLMERLFTHYLILYLGRLASIDHQNTTLSVNMLQCIIYTYMSIIVVQRRSKDRRRCKYTLYTKPPGKKCLVLPSSSPSKHQRAGAGAPLYSTPKCRDQTRPSRRT